MCLMHRMRIRFKLQSQETTTGNTSTSNSLKLSWFSQMLQNHAYRHTHDTHVTFAELHIEALYSK